MRNALLLAFVLACAPLGACASGGTGGTGGGGGGAGAGGAGPSSSSGGGDGGPAICVPGSKLSCYTGPSGTLGVGACKGGEQTCNPEGTGFGLCEGEILPSPESCLTAEDDDCDGTGLDPDVGCICLPNQQYPCYGGPAGTENVGICKGGMATCFPSGMTYGNCVGQVLPEAEDCMTPEDDDCDGTAPPCGGGQVWVEGYGDGSSQVAKGVAVQNDGTSYLTGYMSGVVDFGLGPLVSLGGTDAFLVKSDPNGAALWAKRFGDGSNQQSNAVAVDANGNVAVTGQFAGQIDFGGGAITTAGSNDVFVAKLDPVGNHVWSKGFGNNSNQYGTAVAFTASEVVVAGYIGGAVDFGGGLLTSAGASDAFLARFGADGTHKWSKIFGDAANQFAYGVATAPGGNIVLAGSFGGQINFGVGTLSTAGLNDIFLASFDGAGNAGWSKSFGDNAEQYAYAVAVDPGSGKIAITGSFAGTVDFGGGALTTLGQSDMFLAVFTSAGTHVWSTRFGDVGDQVGRGVTFDAQGNVIVTGSYGGVAGYDVFVAKLDPNGALLWSKQAGDAMDQIGHAIDADASNNVFVAGGFIGSLDFGGGPIVSAGNMEDAFLAKLLP